VKNNYKKHRGFTLVEIIISFALFAILMTPIYSIIISTMNHNKNGAVKQTAALHGQEIFEEIKSGDVVTGKDKDGEIIISKIGYSSISANTWKKAFDGDGYEATVTITKNDSIPLDQKNIPEEEASKVKTSNFNVNLSGSSSPIIVKSDDKDGVLKYDSTLDESLKFIINTKTNGNKKIIVIKDKDNNEILTEELDVKDEEKDNQIKLILNFDGYKALSKTDATKLKNVEVSVYNQNDIPLNLCLQKSMDLDVKIDNKLGNVRVYDNRAEDGGTSKMGELYDISVEVTPPNGDKSKPIFTEKTSQNINVN
jgi:prepilin-type N-terminal cleavage/methylation domain-containing protein